MLVVTALAGTAVEQVHPYRGLIWMAGLSRWWAAHLRRINMQLAGVVMVATGAVLLVAPVSVDAPTLLAGVGLSAFGTLCAWPDEVEDGELFLGIGAMLWLTGWGLFGFSWCLLAACTPVRVSVEKAMLLLPRSMPRIGPLAAGLRRCAGLVLTVAVLPSLAMAVARRMGAGIVIGALTFIASLRQMRSALPADGASVLLAVLVVLAAFVLLQVAAVHAVDAVVRRSGRFKS